MNDLVRPKLYDTREPLKVLAPSLYDYLTEGSKTPVSNQLLGLDPRLGAGLTELLSMALPLPVGKLSAFKQVGRQLGSNPGGVYVGPTGQKFYIKSPLSEDHLRNEMLAGQLYGMSGVKTPRLELVETPKGLAISSAWEPGELIGRMRNPDVTSVQRGLPTDAWLANWDVVGTGGDNVLMTPSGPVRIDLGGSLRYRAQGAPKEFGPSVEELVSIPKFTPEVFGGARRETLVPNARAIGGIPESRIRKAVTDFGPVDARENDRLYRALLERRKDLMRRLELE